MEGVAEQSSNLSGAVAGSLMKACREKTWDEMDTEQRMEKMREEVRYLRRTVTTLEKTIAKFKNHQHAQDGSPLVPMQNRDYDDRPPGYFYDPLK